jgi:glycine/D-amino acid oxidase-like deaminating enzyme/nitrite reductase/ring-hydroxylating ferredoxin subunit
MNTQPPWLGESPKPFPKVDRDLTVDAVIVGGGLTGVTAAHLLAQTGMKVALLERGRIANGETGHTTAHITFPADRRLHALVKDLGKNHAQAVWDAGLAGQEQIAQNVRTEGIECVLRRVPGYLFAAWGTDLEKERELLEQDASLGQEFGFDLGYVPQAPVVKQPAVRFADLLKLHPTRYVQSLAKCARERGAEIFEESPVTEFDEEKRLVKANGQRIHYGHMLLATHVPMQGNAGTVSAAFLTTKLPAYSTYAIRARVGDQSLREALYWDTADPYLYLRIDRWPGEAGVSVILGGEDHKTGQESQTGDCYATLESKLRTLWPDAQVDARWSGQVLETVDGLPLIGETVERQLVATGYSGTGFTFGTLAAIMFRDHVVGTTNPWTDLFRVNRKPLSHAWDYMAENKDYPFYMLKRLVASEEQEATDKLLCGEGKVVRWKGKKVAAFRSEDGAITRLSAVCPHMGCIMTWNEAEKTWDCPCHGSRFTAKGGLIGGPAESDLPPIE